MRTTIDAQGCNTIPGPVGLTVEGDLIVGGMDVAAQLKSLSEKHSFVEQPAFVLDTASEISQIQEELKTHTSAQEEAFKTFESAILKRLSETNKDLTKSLDSALKDLKSTQDDYKKLLDRVKSLESDCKDLTKKFSKSSTGSKKDSDSAETA